MHTVTLLLNTTKYDEQQIERRFHALSHIHNVCVKHAIHLLQRLKFDKEYQDCLTKYKELSKRSKLKKDEVKLKSQISKRMSEIREEIGLTQDGFESYIKVCAKQFTKLLSSQQVQKEAIRVYKGVEKVLFGNGKKIHFKKFRDFDTISGKCNTNGVKFNPDTLSIKWNGLEINCRLPKKKDSQIYLMEALNNEISYCEIKRMMFNNGWHYYVIVYLKGDAPKKLVVGNSTIGIDPGVSITAAVSDTKVFLEELAPRTMDYNKKIVKLQQKLERSRRANNPNKYNPDGTFNKSNKDKWVYTKTYFNDLNRLKTLYRQKSATTKQSHCYQCNRYLEDSCVFIVEHMDYKALQKRSKKTERQDKLTDIVQKDGTVKSVHKHKKKKRFGKSLNNRAPALKLSILKQKCKQYDCDYFEINTQTFKASKYNHVKDTYEDIPLSQREKRIGRHKVQRDLYSAFLIKNSDGMLEHPDKDLCNLEFKRFVKLQNQLIKDMKTSGITMKQCFGF